MELLQKEQDPVKAQEVFEGLCRSLTPDALLRLEEVIRGGQLARGSQTVVKIAELLMAYGFGRPKQSMEVQGNTQNQQTVIVIERADRRS